METARSIDPSIDRPTNAGILSKRKIVLSLSYFLRQNTRSASLLSLHSSSSLLRIPRAPPLSNLPPHTGHKTIPLPLNRERKHIAFIVELSLDPLPFSGRLSSVHFEERKAYRKELSASFSVSKRKKERGRRERKGNILKLAQPLSSLG